MAMKPQVVDQSQGAFMSDSSALIWNDMTFIKHVIRIYNFLRC